MSTTDSERAMFDTWLFNNPDVKTWRRDGMAFAAFQAARMTWPAERASMARQDRAYRLRTIRTRIELAALVAFFTLAVGGAPCVL